MVFDALANLKKLASQNTPTKSQTFSSGGFKFNTPSTVNSLFGSNNAITSGESTRNIIGISRALEVENSISNTSLFQGQNQLFQNQQDTNQSLSNFANEVKNAFSSILQPSQNIKNTTDNVNKDPAPKTEGAGFIDSAKVGFNEIISTIGPGGIVAAAVIGGFLLLKK